MPKSTNIGGLITTATRWMKGEIIESSETLNAYKIWLARVLASCKVISPDDYSPCVFKECAKKLLTGHFSCLRIGWMRNPCHGKGREQIYCIFLGKVI